MKKRKPNDFETMSENHENELLFFTRQYFEWGSNIDMIDQAAQAVAGDKWETFIDAITSDHGNVQTALAEGNINISPKEYGKMKKRFFYALDALREDHIKKAYHDRKLSMLQSVGDEGAAE